MKRAFFFILLAFVVNSNSALAERGGGRPIFNWGDNWHPPRGRILFHNELDIGSGFSRHYHIVAPDAFEDLDCELFVGLGMHIDTFVMEPALGWDFGDGEPIGSLRLSFTDKRVYRYLQLDYQPESGYCYGLVQAQRLVSRFFDFGIESEGWTAARNRPESWGLGPNMRFHMRSQRHKDSKLSLDIAFYYRQEGGNWKPEVYVRLHLVPKLEF